MKRIYKKYILIGAIFTIICTSIGFYKFHQRIHLCVPYPYTYINSHYTDSIISVIIIGDSWGDLAYQNKIPHYIDSVMLKNGIKTKTIAKGEHGATSKRIYESLHTDKHQPNTTHTLIKCNPQYAIVFCGINDSHGQYGKSFYAYHTSLIIQELLHYQITPIILELPYYDIAKQYAYYNFIKRITYKLLSLLTDQTTDIKNMRRYRLSLKERLSTQGIYDKVRWISIDSLSTNKYYRDYMHLNSKGYQYLSHIIIQTILNDLQQ